MNKEEMELFNALVGYVRSIAVDLGYFADKARAEDARELARNKPPEPSPDAPSGDL